MFEIISCMCDCDKVATHLNQSIFSDGLNSFMIKILFLNFLFFVGLKMALLGGLMKYLNNMEIISKMSKFLTLEIFYTQNKL